MGDKILEFFKSTKHEFHSIDELKCRFVLDNNELDKYLSKLELKGLVYKNEQGKYSCVPENYITGQLQTTSKGNKYIELENGIRINISKQNLNGALNFDTVMIEKGSWNKDSFDGKVVKILKRENPNIVCEVRNVNGIKNLVAFNISSDTKFNIDKETFQNLVDGDRIVIQLSKECNNGMFDAKFLKHLCHKDDPDRDIKTIAINNDFDIEFSKETLKEVEKIPTCISNKDIENHLELRDKMIFTIDSDHTKDIDDAISLDVLPNGNYELGVHIAHVSHYVKKGSAIFEDAYNRGTSAYLLDYVIPMIHHKLSNGICSLNEGEDRLTRSCIMEIDKYGNVVNYKICKSIINSKKKMTYDAVNEILEKDIVPEGYEKFADKLKQMGQLSNILTNMRNNNGALAFASSELRTELNEQGKATEFKLEEQRSAEKLIENFMVIANETVATHVNYLNLPFIYRVHACPTEKVLNKTIDFISELGYRLSSVKNASNPKLVQAILNQLSKHEEFPILSNLLLRSMKRAKYDTINIGHFGLASNIYTHFTSPIRRFPDLMVHTLLDEYDKIYDNKNFNQESLQKYLIDLEQFLTEACKHSSYKERQADLAEEESNKFKMLEYMEQYVGQSFEGIIMMIDGKGVTVKTDNLITGKIKFEDIKGDAFNFRPEKSRVMGKNTKKQYRIGNRVSITVKRVAREDKEIYFYLDENLSRGENKVKQKRY